MSITILIFTVIKSGGYKIAAPDIEREIHGLPYVDEAMVVGVNDLEYGQRIAAAVVLHNDLEVSVSFYFRSVIFVKSRIC